MTDSSMLYSAHTMYNSQHIFRMKLELIVSTFLPLLVGLSSGLILRKVSSFYKKTLMTELYQIFHLTIFHAADIFLLVQAKIFAALRQTKLEFLRNFSHKNVQILNAYIYYCSSAKIIVIVANPI